MLAHKKQFLRQCKILNYVQGVEIKMAPGKGRGIFATKSLKAGELVIVEKAVAEACPETPSAGSRQRPEKYLIGAR